MKNKNYTLQDRLAEKSHPILQYKKAVELGLEVEYPFQPKHLRAFIKDYNIRKNDGSEYPPKYAIVALSNANIKNTASTTVGRYVTTRRINGKNYYFFIDDPDLDLI